MSTELRHKLDYAPRAALSMLPTRRELGWIIRIAGLTALVFWLVIGLYFFGSGYASKVFPRVTYGMTRAQVDGVLWAFGSSVSPYNGVGPTEAAVAYEFLWYGKETRIIVIFDAKGVVTHTIPIFDVCD